MTGLGDQARHDRRLQVVRLFDHPRFGPVNAPMLKVLVAAQAALRKASR